VQFDGRFSIADRQQASTGFSEGGTMTKLHIATAAMVALIATAAGAQSTAKVPVAPESKLWIDGTSNLHGWSCKATTLDADIEFDAVAANEVSAAAPKALKKVNVKIPVKSLKCGHGGMDDNLYKALKANDTPEISYILGTFEAAGETKDGYTLKTIGTLTIAGKQNKVEMDVVATRLADGTLKAKGVVPIKMTDYGIQPPTAIFGRLKTGDEVKVNFELSVGGKAIAAMLNQDK
jgi:polyisoprenoid-binding protein YceI